MIERGNRAKLPLYDDKIEDFITSGNPILEEIVKSYINNFVDIKDLVLGDKNIFKEEQTND